MSLQQMREWLKGYYKNAVNWSRKVDKMSEAQVTAVYLRLSHQEGKR